MDFHSVMETFAEAWVAANTHTPLTVAAEQGLINGPNNHTPSRALPAHSGSSHSSPVQVVPSHPPAAHCNAPNGPINHGTAIPDLATPSPNLSHSPIHHTQPVLCTLQDISSERNDTECSSEGESNKIPERSSDDSPSHCSNLTEMKSSFALSKPRGKSLPVHCIVEQSPGPQACGQHVELDSYAIVPCDTLFNDLVRTALVKLGYSSTQILGAKGSIQIKKWKPLAFDQITENPEATVADILGELSTVASLHVRLYSVPDDPCEWKDTTVRNAVLELLREMSQSKLAKLCPLSQPMLSNIINNRYLGKIGKEKCQEFGLWYLNYRKQNPEGSILEVVPSDRPTDGRLTFHPTKELPLMRDWFHACRNPPRRTLQMYVDILNQGPVRQQERPKIALGTLKNWWKNEKQRERKHLRGDEKVDDPGKPRKKKKLGVLVSTEDLKDGSSEHSMTNNSTHVEIKLNSFTLINHSENESDAEKNDKKDCDVTETTTLPPHSNPFVKSNSSEMAKSNSCINMINYAETSGEANKFPVTENNTINCNILHPTKASVDSNTPSKFPVGVQSILQSMIDRNQNMFPFSDPRLNMHNCTKICCDGNIERTNIINGNSSQVNSEDDIDHQSSLNLSYSQI